MFKDFRKKVCIALLLWAAIWTMIGALYINRVGFKALFQNRNYTFVITPEGIVKSIENVSDLITLKIRREYMIQDSTPPILSTPIQIGGRKTKINFVVLYTIGFDVSKITKKDVKIEASKDTIKILLTMPKPIFDVKVERWWVVSEELGIFGTSMKSYEASPIFDKTIKYAKSRMEEELPQWNKELTESTERVLSNLFSSILGKPAIVIITGIRI